MNTNIRTCMFAWRRSDKSIRCRGHVFAVKLSTESVALDDVSGTRTAPLETRCGCSTADGVLVAEAGPCTLTTKSIGALNDRRGFLCTPKLDEWVKWAGQQTMPIITVQQRQTHKISCTAYIYLYVSFLFVYMLFFTCFELHFSMAKWPTRGYRASMSCNLNE